MAKKFMVYSEDEIDETKYEYSEGEVIRVCGTDGYVPHKCVKKEKKPNGDIYHYWKKGKVSYSF